MCIFLKDYSRPRSRNLRFKLNAYPNTAITSTMPRITPKTLFSATATPIEHIERTPASARTIITNFALFIISETSNCGFFLYCETKYVFSQGFRIIIYKKIDTSHKKSPNKMNCAIITQLWTRNKKSGVEQ